MQGVIKSIDCLKNFPLFQDIDYEYLEEIFESSNIIRFKKAQCIFYEGTRPQGIYCILQGKLKVVKLCPEGREQIINLVKEGDVLGLRCVMTKEEYTNSAITLEEADICYISKDKFFEIIQKNPSVNKLVIEYVCKKLDMLENKIIHLSQRSVRERLAINLLLLNQYFGIPKNNGILIDVSLSREEMANLVGTATETVIRLLSEFRRDGIVNFSGKKMTITNLANLRKITDVF